MLHGVTAEPAAAVSALVRTRLHGVVREPVNGEAGTGDARSAAATSRGDARSRRSRPGRVRRGGPDGWPDESVERSAQRVGPATAVSAANRRASGARSERSERRREGYPPEGPRPRSGLGRVARSRSDAPSLNVCIPEPVSIFSSSVCTTTGTTVVINGCMGAIIIGSIMNGTGVRTIIEIVGGEGCTLRSCPATR